MLTTISSTVMCHCGIVLPFGLKMSRTSLWVEATHLESVLLWFTVDRWWSTQSGIRVYSGGTDAPERRTSGCNSGIKLSMVRLNWMTVIWSYYWPSMNWENIINLYCVVQLIKFHVDFRNSHNGGLIARSIGNESINDCSGFRRPLSLHVLFWY